MAGSDEQRALLCPNGHASLIWMVALAFDHSRGACLCCGRLGEVHLKHEIPELAEWIPADLLRDIAERLKRQYAAGGAWRPEQEGHV